VKTNGILHLIGTFTFSISSYLKSPVNTFIIIFIIIKIVIRLNVLLFFLPFFSIFFLETSTFFCLFHSSFSWSITGVPNLGYMYPQGPFSLSEGVHLRPAEDEKNVFTYYLFPNIYTYTTKYYCQKSLQAYS